MEEPVNKGGRPRKPEGEKLVERSVRLKPAHWVRLAELGGLPWLRALLDATPAPKKRPPAER